MLLHLKKYLVSGATTEARAALLETAPWSRHLEGRQLNLVAQFLELYEIPTAVEVIGEGTKDDFIGILSEGTIKVCRENVTLATFSRGQTIGEVTFIDGGVRSATCITERETKLLVLTKVRFNELLQDKPKVAAKVLLIIAQLLCQRLRHTSSKLIDLCIAE